MTEHKKEKPLGHKYRKKRFKKKTKSSGNPYTDKKNFVMSTVKHARLWETLQRAHIK